jgi:hypothetical protein
MREVIEDNIKLGMVVYACNPSYLASRHKEIGELKNSLGKVSMTCSQENKIKANKRAGAIAQEAHQFSACMRPWVQPPVPKKKKKKKNKRSMM